MSVLHQGKRLRVSAVTCEHFVASLTGEHDFDLFRRQLRNEIKRYRGRESERLVLVPHQPRKRSEEVVGIDYDLIVFRPESVCDSPCEGELVRALVLERD